MCQFIDEGDGWTATDDRFNIHFLDYNAPVRNLLPRQDLDIGGKLSRQPASMRLEETDDRIGPALLASNQLLQRRVGLPNARGVSEIDAVPSTLQRPPAGGCGQAFPRRWADYRARSLPIKCQVKLEHVHPRLTENSRRSPL